MYQNNQKYNVTEFNAVSEIKINNIIYENIVIYKYCNM